MKNVFKRVLGFSGRIDRAEYNLTLFLLIISRFVLEFLMTFSKSNSELDTFVMMIFTILLALLSLWILLAQSVKRCHDIDLSGWYIIIPFFSIFLMFKKGDPNRNEYGSVPD